MPFLGTGIVRDREILQLIDNPCCLLRFDSFTKHSLFFSFINMLLERVIFTEIYVLLQL